MSEKAISNFAAKRVDELLGASIDNLEAQYLRERLSERVLYLKEFSDSELKAWLYEELAKFRRQQMSAKALEEMHIFAIELGTTKQKEEKLFTLVSEEDKDLNNHFWRLVAFRYAGNAKLGLMHRIILARMLQKDKLEFWEKVDHIDGNGCNNLRTNLRLATHSQNLANRGKTIENTSGYKGVSWDKFRKKWKATISFNGKFYFLGRFTNKEDARSAYKKKADELHKEYVNYG